MDIINVSLGLEDYHPRTIAASFSKFFGLCFQDVEDFLIGNIVKTDYWPFMLNEMKKLSPQVLGMIIANAKGSFFSVHGRGWLERHEHDPGGNLLEIVAATAVFSDMYEFLSENRSMWVYRTSDPNEKYFIYRENDQVTEGSIRYVLYRVEYPPDDDAAIRVLLEDSLLDQIEAQGKVNENLQEFCKLSVIPQNFWAFFELKNEIV